MGAERSSVRMNAHFVRHAGSRWRASAPTVAASCESVRGEKGPEASAGSGWHLARFEGDAVDTEAKSVRRQAQIVLAERLVHDDVVGSWGIDREVGRAARIVLQIAAGVALWNRLTVLGHHDPIRLTVFGF